MNATTTTFNFTAFNFAVVSFRDFESWAEDLIDFDTLNDLLGTFTLNIDAHDLAIADC